MTRDPLTAMRSIPSQSAAEMSRFGEYAWLDEISKKLDAELKEIIAGYGKMGGDDNIENAINNLEAAIDDIGRRMSRLDEGE